jgi:putative aminopeptidase FrvX
LESITETKPAGGHSISALTVSDHAFVLPIFGVSSNKSSMAKSSKTQKVSQEPPAFLLDLLNARSPSGNEEEAQQVFERHMGSHCDKLEKDTMGNRYAHVGVGNKPTLLLAGHLDEIALIICHVDERGFLYFDTIGGHDRILISGRRVTILNAKGTVTGITGKRAVHLMDPEDRKKVPELHQMWIDIGASSREEALKRVSIGDSAVYQDGFSWIQAPLATSRAFDDKAGAYVVGEVVRRLFAKKNKLTAEVVAAATTQEEIGTRGAMVAGYRINPDFALAVDVGHATDHPDADPRKYGLFKLGGGPIICRGPNINPWVFKRLMDVATKEKIPVQIEADPRPTGTDARALQVNRDGIATGLVSIPLRYMHTPCEMANLDDIEHAVQLITAFALSLSSKDRGIW